MTPEASVLQFAEIIQSMEDFSEERLFYAMTAAEVPPEMAQLTFKFTQTAWGRDFLDNLGITFFPDYVCLNAAGDVIESGLLRENPFFVTASGIAARYKGSEAYTRLALMSSDVSSINNQLHAGADPADLVVGTAALFLERPTEAGIEKATRRIQAGLIQWNKEQSAKPPPRKSWWQFWK